MRRDGERDRGRERREGGRELWREGSGGREGDGEQMEGQDGGGSEGEMQRTQ